MKNTIYFDMDGTIADLYGVENWLQDLRNENVRPYKEARPLINMQALARSLNRLHRQGYKIGVVSWLSKNGQEEYNKKVTETKINWLKKHLKSVDFSEIHIVKYGTPKEKVVTDKNGILFDDEIQNRKNWQGIAFSENRILEVLRAIQLSSFSKKSGAKIHKKYKIHT